MKNSYRPVCETECNATETKLGKRLRGAGLFFVLASAVSGFACGGVSETEHPSGQTSAALSTGLVISQVFGAGGNTNAPYKADYVELFNAGAADVSTHGLSLQYASATGTFNPAGVVGLPDATIHPGQYYLVVLGPAGDAGVGLVGDFTPATTVNLSASAGKIALVQGTTNLACGGDSGVAKCAPLAIDFVGYGATASDFEGTTFAPAPGSNVNAIFRAGGGCTETDQNGSDFAAAAANPRTTATTYNVCAVVTPDAGADPDAGGQPDAGDDGATGDDASTGDDGATGNDSATGDDASSGDDGSTGNDASTGDDASAGDDAATDATVGPDATTGDDAGDAAVPDAAPPVDAGPPIGLINEVKVAPINVATGFQYVELRGPAGTTLPSNTYFLGINSDPASPGTITYSRDLSGVVFGTNGLIFVQATATSPYTPAAATTTLADSVIASNDVFSHNAATFLFVTASAPLSITANTTKYGDLSGISVVDGVAYRKGATDPTFGNAPVIIASTTGPKLPHGVTRFLGDDAAMSATSWYYGRLGASGTPASANTYTAVQSPNFPAGGRLTPGDANTLDTSAPSDAGTDSGNDAGNDGGTTIPDAGGDASTVTDAGHDASTDAGAPDSSAGHDASTDASTPDSSTGDDDASVADASTPTDASTHSDASTVRSDAGKDAGSNDQGGGDDSGCSCTTAGAKGNDVSHAAFAAFGTLLVGLRLRRRSRARA